MTTELVVNVIIISIVGTVCFILIALRCYISCRRNSQEVSVRSLNDLYQPQIQVKQQQLSWIPEQQQLPNQQCCICLENNVNANTSCNHKFHIGCIVQWKRRLKLSCPYCKGNSLEKIQFYCHSCRHEKFIYHFQPPMIQQRMHMVPRFFLQFSKNDKKLACKTCGQKQSDQQLCKTKKFDSAFNSQQNKKKIKISRDRQPVNIQLISFATSSQRMPQSQNQTDQQYQSGPATGQRLLRINQ